MKFWAYIFSIIAILRIFIVGLIFVLIGVDVISSQDVYILFHVVVSKIFVFYGILLWIPLIWAFPLMKKVKRSYLQDEPTSDGFKFCVILLLSPLAGVYLFCAKDDFSA